MKGLRFPVGHRIVTIYPPDDHATFLIRYLTATLGKDRRTGREVPSPREYAHAILRRRSGDLRARGGEAYEEMEAQIATYLGKAEDAAHPDEPNAWAVADFLIHGTGDTHEAFDGELETKRGAAWALLGHRPDDDLSCAICAAATRRNWSEVLELTETPPELMRELYRNFIATGYDGIDSF